MNKYREMFLKETEDVDKRIFDKIKNNPKPDIIDLWSLSERRFIEWRQTHDFPVLMSHFDKTLRLFKEWKEENNLTNEIIIATGFLTPFLEPKKSSKDKNLFLTKIVDDDIEFTVVNYQKVEGERTYLGSTYHSTYIQTFTSYLDWLHARGQHQEILYINSRSSPNTNLERVFIHADVYVHRSDFELLKMGGISLPEKHGTLFRGKRLEFVNLCGIDLRGDIYFGEYGNLSCHYCACDNWIAEDFNMPTVKLEHCTVANFTMVSSKLQQWSFYNCNVSGDFYNSKLYSTKIVGGSFNPVLLDCTLVATHIHKEHGMPDNNFNGYKAFKKVYQAQGEDDIARHYFIEENEWIRSNLKGWQFITKSISFYYWEYGRKPHRIIYLSIAIIFTFGFIFWLGRAFINSSGGTTNFGLGDGLYFSTITFTTLGYGDFSPTGWLKLLCSLEAFLGVINMGFLIAGYSNNKY